MVRATTSGGEVPDDCSRVPHDVIRLVGPRTRGAWGTGFYHDEHAASAPHPASVSGPSATPVADVVAATHEVASQVASGRLNARTRRRLAWVSLGALLAFVVDTVVVVSGVFNRSFDQPVARAVQSVPWGPLGRLMDVTNSIAGWQQNAVGLAAVLGMLVYERRAGGLMALAAVGSLLDGLIKVSVGRHRPTPDLLLILNPASGYSFPSGHAVFFTWLYFMLAVAISPRLAPRWRAPLWSLAAALVCFACLGRVYAGVHWPTDVIGGFLLALSWSTFVLWLPERWLPSPHRWRVPRRG